MGPLNKLGYIRGRHYTTYVQDVRNLKKDGDIKIAERLLKELVNATEAEDKVEKSSVAPWYYEELAKIYRKEKDYASEVKILERFAKQRHGRGVKPPKLLERLEKAKELQHKAS